VEAAAGAAVFAFFAGVFAVDGTALSFGRVAPAYGRVLGDR
jgi:hypothetical protein